MPRSVGLVSRVGGAGLVVVVLAGVVAAASGAGQPEGRVQARPGRVGGTPDWALSFGGKSHFSEPSKSATMGFDVPTSIHEVLVRGGQEVTEGDLLVRGDGSEEVALYETQKLQTEQDLDVQRARKMHELRVVQYKNTAQANVAGAVSPLELDERRVSAEVAEVDVDLAVMGFEQAKLQVDRYKARVDRLRVYAPFDGIVEQVAVGVGDTSSEGQPVLTLVNIDRLRADVPADTTLTLELDLKPGDPAWVLVDAPGEKKVYVGEVMEVSPRTHYATQQRRVRVEFPNPEGLPAGLPIWVRFTEPTDEWRDRVAPVDDRAALGDASLRGVEFTSNGNEP